MTDLNEALIDQSCLLRATGLLDHLVGRRPVAADADADRGAAAQPVRLRLAAASARAAAGRSARSRRASSTTRWTTRSSRTQGKRLTASIDLAVLGGNTQFYKPRLEGICFHRHLPRTSFGFRAQAEYIRAGRQDRVAADLRAAVPRRRIQRARLRHPVDRSDGARVGRRARRQQEPAVQRRVPDLDRRARCASCSSTTPARCATSARASRGRRT